MSMIGQMVATVPMGVQVNIGLLWAATVLCGVGMLYGIVRRRRELPETGKNFPSEVDMALGGFILLVFGVTPGLDALATSTSGIGGAPTSFTAKAFILNLAIFVPMMLRWVVLPKEEGRMRLLPSCGWAAAVLGLTFAFNAIYTQSGLFECITSGSGSDTLQEPMQILRDGDTVSRWLVVIAAVLVAPVGEECCFRGIVYGTLRRSVGKAPAVALSSFFFGALHMSLGHTLPLVVFAALLCLLYEKTRSLRAGMVAHAVFNALNIAILFITES